MKKEDYKILTKAEKKKVKFKDLPIGSKRGAIISLLIVFVVFPFVCSKIISSPASTQNLDNLTPTQKDSAIRISKIQDQFSSLDGSNYSLVRYMKENMNDPESFQHVKTLFWNYGKNIVVQMTYRGKNGFGALVLGDATAEITPDGTIVSVK